MSWITATVMGGLSLANSAGEHYDQKKKIRDHNKALEGQKRSIETQRSTANLDIQQREAETNRMMNDVNGVKPETMQAIASRWGNLISGRTQMEGAYLGKMDELRAQRISQPAFNWGGAIADASLAAFQGYQMGTTMKREDELHSAVMSWYNKKDETQAMEKASSIPDNDPFKKGWTKAFSKIGWGQ